MTRRTAKLCVRQTRHENIYLHVAVFSIIIILFHEQKYKNSSLMLCKHPEVFKIIKVHYNQHPKYYVKRVF